MWLSIYVAYLVGFYLIHGPALSIGAIVVYTHPSLAGPQPFVPLGALVFYVAGNVAEAVYTVVLLFLMLRRRKSAVINNLIFNAGTVLFLIAWHVLGEKSVTGLVVDSLPGVLGFLYIWRSSRVRTVFIR